MKRRALAIIATGLFFVLTATTPAMAAESITNDDVMAISGSLSIPAGETVEDVFLANGDVVIAGNATGSVVALNGDIRVAGRVDGDVVAPNGRANVLAAGRVDGDVRSRYTPIVATGAEVAGDIGTTDITNLAQSLALMSRIAWWVMATLSVLAIGLCISWLAPAKLQTNFSTGSAIGWGALAFFGLPVLALIAAATIVGIPLAIGLFAAMGLIYGVGYAAGALLLGRAIVKDRTNRYVAFLAGWAILRVAALVPFVATVAWMAAAVIGLGFIIKTAWTLRARVQELPATSTRTATSATATGAGPATTA